MLNRRDALKLAAGSAAVGLIPAVATPATAAAGFTLPPLPYPVDALEPHVDAKTMEIHHGKHHKTYVDNLNKALEGNADWLAKSPTELLVNLKEVPEKARLAVQNNGGGHWNHSLFWATLGKPGTGPKGDLEAALNGSFGGLDGFKKQFKDAALKRFGSGWAWLVPAAGKKLEVVSTSNQDNPLMTGGMAPVLGIDVWEHAYYLKYQNKRADYVDAFFNVINWDAVAANFADAGKK